MISFKDPKISVITVVLDGVETIEKTFNSIFQQQYPNIELIVIDGGSTDGTLDIIKAHSPRIPYWETGLDRGISDAFNRGLSKVTGDLIAILNSDDQWFPNTVNEVVNSYKTSPDVDIFYGNVRFLNGHRGESYSIAADLDGIQKHMSIFHPSLFVKKNAYKIIGGYSDSYKYAMDSHWVHRALNAGLKFQKIDKVLAQMRLGGLSDREFLKSLSEYRRSVIENQLLGPLRASYYFLKYSFFKILMCSRILNRLKNKIYYKREICS